MTTYTPPLDEITFVLRELSQLDAIAGLDTFRDAGLGALDELLAEAGRFAAEVVAPTNRDGDRIGSRLTESGVVTPDGFAKAYDQYVTSGWAAAGFDAEYGGGGLPRLVTMALQELWTSSNVAWSLCPMLTHGAIHLLSHHGDDEQKARWLPKLVSGEWTGTMNLTEPEAGSDLGAVSTKAVRQPDGTYRITGQKIFITYGDHDMADNIVHLTLARVPDAPAGTRGISCFIVPKMLVDDDGNPTGPNSVSAVSVEHKLGIHGSPTCVMAFDDAVGYLVGEENAGIKYMFTMMNSARLDVALEGVGIAERAYQQASEFARERRQGKDLEGDYPVAIVGHPDVRRMLLTMRALVEATRAVCYLTAASTDLALHHPDPAVAEAAAQRVELLTPIAKGWSTDSGTEVASLGVQVHGGYGYIEETGAAQHLRDVRITSIYEGTNGIQAIDLATRKLGMREGAVVSELLAEIAATRDQLREQGFEQEANRLSDALTHAETASSWLLEHRDERADVLAGATPYLRLMGLTVGGWLMAKSLLAVAGEDTEFARRKSGTARFYLTQILPQVSGLTPAVTAGALALDAA